MRIFIWIAVVLALACDSGSSSTSSAVAEAAVTEIAQQTLMDQPAGTSFILDVRTPEEYAEGHVPNAINVPHDQVEARLAELEAHKDGPVVVYCKSGRRAGLAAEVLAKAGFTNLQHLTGDMQAWTAAGLPVEKTGS